MEFYSCRKYLKEDSQELLKSLAYGTAVVIQRQHPPKFKQLWKSPSVRCIPGTRPGCKCPCVKCTLSSSPSTPKLKTGNKEGRCPLSNQTLKSSKQVVLWPPQSGNRASAMTAEAQFHFSGFLYSSWVLGPWSGAAHIQDGSFLQ